MTQQDLFGFDLPYTCRKCGRSFQTMKESSKHHATKHKKRIIEKITVNLALENFKLISTKTKVVHYAK